MSNRLQQLIVEKNWEKIVQEFSHDDLARILPFKDAMFLAKDLFFENFDNSPRICDFATNLFFAIRRYHETEWDKDWKNDIFLSEVCRISYKYDESYFCCMRAYKRVKDRPSALLKALAGCFFLPSSRISVKEAVAWAKEAFQKEPSYEAALLLRGLYGDMNDKDQRTYWDKIVTDLEQKNILATPSDPDIFEESSSTT